MLRFFKAVPRAIRQQWLRPGPQSVHCEEEEDRAKKLSLLPQNYLHCYQQRWPWAWPPDHSDERRDRGQRAQTHQEWSVPNCQHGFLEAVGWGTAILLGLQLSRLYHLKACHDQQASLDSDETSPLRWFCRLSHQGLNTVSYISNASSVESGKTLYSLPAKDGTKRRASIAVSCEDVDGLDYESLLDIEVKETDFETSLRNDSGKQGEFEVITNDRDSSTENVKEQRSVDLGLSPAERALQEAVEDWCTLSNRCTAQVLHRFALHNAHHGYHDEAFKQWQQACDHGDPRAHFNLALCYELGRGTKQDLNKAVNHYAIAAAGGHHAAMYNLAVYYLDGRGGLTRDVNMATTLLERAASEGMSRAQTDLGVLLSERDKDWHQPAETLDNTRLSDDMTAKYYLGVCHENGWGVPEDLHRAAELYTTAAAAGNPRAMQSLGIFKETGKGGLEVDRQAACDLYLKAAKAGHKTAEADHRRLRQQLDLEIFERELQELVNTQSFGCRRSKSSPTLSSSFSFYIRDNLLDFGLDDLHSSQTQPELNTQTDPNIKFHIGEPDHKPPPEPGGPTDLKSTLPGGVLNLFSGGFGDIQIKNKAQNKTPKLHGSFGNFDRSEDHKEFTLSTDLNLQTDTQLTLYS